MARPAAVQERNTLLSQQLAEDHQRAEQMGRVNDALAEEERLLEAFHETGKTLLGSLDLENILDTLSLQVIQAGIFRSVMVALVDNDRRTVRVTRSFTRQQDESGEWRRAQPGTDANGIEYDFDDDNVTAQVARTGRMAVIDGWSKRFDQRFSPPNMPAKTSYFIPIVHNTRTVAVLATASEPEEREEMLRKIDVLGPFFDLFAIALHHADLYHNLQERERELRESQKIEIMGELTAGIAHNFNNLLQGIIGNLDFALETPGEAPLLIGKALESTESLAEMLRQLMSYSRKGLAPERVPMRLRTVVDSVTRVCRSTFDRRIVIGTHIADDLPAIDGNAGQLEQVLLNLCVNARDGLAEVTGRTPRIDIGVTAEHVDEQEMVLLQVRDNGIGIEPAVQARMFDPFFTTKEVGRGTGLGLSSVHGSVSHHGGWIACESKPGEGTTFGVYLHPAEVARTTVPAGFPLSASIGSGKILLIEDEESVRYVAERTLVRHGYTVLLAIDGEQGLQMLADQGDQVDLVLLDLWLPKLSGHEVLERMEEPCPPVVLFTGFAAPGNVSERVVATLEKPASPAALVDCVARVLEEHKPKRS
ncbi:MAG: response regulator [Gemmatimonadetes bacterium]|jgi:signal transduction histidine kinase|nr:response regulator [Gemmatimonadota bacterium]